MNKRKNIKIALTCTRGGHFEQMTNLSDFYSDLDHFWITNRNRQTENKLGKETVYYVGLAHFKRPWTYAFQVPSVLRIFLKEKPTHVLSTGSGRTALVPFLLAKLFDIKFLYIDTFSRVHGHSKFGTFLLKTGNRIYTQWKDPENEKAVYIGPIFKGRENGSKRTDPDYVFVTVGTRDEPFTRLIKAVEHLVRKGTIRERVVVQAGHTEYRSDCLEVFDFCPHERIDELILNARYVITQESAGIGTQCLKNRTPFIVMPREYQYGELPSKSDMKEDLQDKLEELGYTKVVTDIGELEGAIVNLEALKTGFKFDNRVAISNLQKALEGL